ncbi:MAG: VCBS repeat-containing protein, partial [Methanomassiliicoccales archaeon]|nr:VCBS repeat-containing protein [Methanomassiliicoccales archaeon]
MSSIKKKFKWSRKGVSEIIGNILILGITVTLFSSIMYFVASMPPPQENAYADFSVQPRWVHDMQVTLNITHIGGQELKNSTTRMILTLNGIQYVQYITDSSPSIGTTWTTGETWRYSVPLLLGENPYGTLNVMVIDTEKGNVVWSGAVAGGTVGAGVKPIISARGTSPSPSYTGDQVWLYATVTDPDGDLNMSSVFIDLSSIGYGSHVKMNSSYGDNIFRVGPYTADISWNGKTVIINATDLNHHSETGLLTLTIYPKQGQGGGDQYGPYYNYSHYLINGTYPPDATGGEAGSGSGTTFYYIRRASDLTITKDFDPGERVLIELYSNALSNLALENSFAIYHPITGDEIYPQTKLVDAFQYGGIYGTFNKYIYNFTAPGDPYAYPLNMKFKDSTGIGINLADTITVSGVTYPRLETYKLVGTDLVKTTNFNHTDTMYLRIITRDVDRNSNTVYLSDLEISDYTGRYIVKKVPPAYAEPPAYSAPISSLFKTSGTSTARIYEGTSNGQYSMYIVLKDAYQGWWLPKKNSYTLKILQVRDTGTGGTTAEVYNLLNLQVNVTAPLSTTDLVATVGSGSFTWSASGASWSNNQVAWYSGGEQWDETVIDDNPNKGCIGIAMADISGDGRNDVVIG